MNATLKAVKESSHDVHVPGILFVDDEPSVLKSLARFSRKKNWNVFLAGSGPEGLEVLKANSTIDVVVSDMRMPGMSGSEFLLKVKENCPNAVRILLTGFSDLHALESAINEAGIYNYLTKPWDDHLLNEVLEGALRTRATERERSRLEELTRKQNRQLGKLALSLDKQVKERTIEIEQALTLLQLSNDRVQSTLYDALKVFNHIIEWKEGRDSGHNRFVSEYSEKIAKKLKMNQEDIENVRIAGFLHRVGMLGLPDELRTRPVFGFSSEELELYSQVPVWGEMALSSAPALTEVAKLIRHHREFVNGKGYPDQLALNQIPSGSLILGLVSDFYDAFNGRLVRNLSGLEGAKTYIAEWTGKKYDAGMVDVLWHVLGDFGENIAQQVIVPMAELKEGMTLNEDVVTKSGVLLLTKGSVLQASGIAKIKSYAQKYKENFELSVIVEPEAK